MYLCGYLLHRWLWICRLLLSGQYRRGYFNAGPHCNALAQINMCPVLNCNSCWNFDVDSTSIFWQFFIQCRKNVRKALNQRQNFDCACWVLICYLLCIVFFIDMFSTGYNIAKCVLGYDIYACISTADIKRDIHRFLLDKHVCNTHW